MVIQPWPHHLAVVSGVWWRQARAQSWLWPPVPFYPRVMSWHSSWQGVHAFKIFNSNLKEEHCRALANQVRTDLKIRIFRCKIESRFLSDILRRNSSVKTLEFDTVIDGSGQDHIHALAQALPNNNGLEDLKLENFAMSDETWNLLFDSMSTHPQLLIVRVSDTAGHPATLSDESKSNRLRAIARMLQHNTAVHTALYWMPV
jgi:hypothetical protein